MEINDSCVVCGKPAAHTHHRKLRSQGGGDEPANLIRLCVEDHAWVHANPSEAYARGLLVHSWADPEHVEVEGYKENVYTDSESFLASFDEPQPGETCERCKRRVPHPKKASSPKTKVWSTRVPVGDEETFSELVDAAAEHHGLSGKPHFRYWCLLYGLTLLLQADKGDLPVG